MAELESLDKVLDMHPGLRVMSLAGLDIESVQLDMGTLRSDWIWLEWSFGRGGLSGDWTICWMQARETRPQKT